MKIFKTITITALVLAFLSMPIPAKAQSKNTPGAVVEEFYNWYFAEDTKYRETIHEQGKYFEPVLFENLVAGLQKPQGPGGWVDFDPFLNAQWDGKSATVIKETIDKDSASVIVDIQLTRGRHDLKIYLKKIEGQWKIANFIYDKDFDLLSFLKKINK